MQYPMIAQPQFAFAPTFAKGGMADAAQAVQSQGRGKDTMLVHMTPNEVKGLQALAATQGGSLTINPATGLPEAGILDAILPMIAGFALGPAGFALMSAPMAAMTVGGVTALATGDLMKGVSAGLGAFGGANLGAALSSTGSEAAKLAALPDAGASIPASMGGTGASTGSIMGDTIGASIAPAGSAMAPAAPGFSLSNMYTPAQTAALQAGAPTGFSAVGPGIQDLAAPGGFGRFGSAFAESAGGPMGTTLAAMGAAQPVMAAFEPKPYDFSGGPSETSNYAGPYLPSEREARFPTERDREDSSEFSYFTPSNPYPGFRTAAAGGAMYGYQEGGEVDRAVRSTDPAAAGKTPEFNYNFRPVEVYTPPPEASAARGLPAMLGGKGLRGKPIGYTESGEAIYSNKTPSPQANFMAQFFARVAEQKPDSAFARMFGGLGARRNPNIPAGMSTEDAKKYGYDKFKNPELMRYDAATQRLVPKEMASGGLAALNAFNEGGVSLDDGAFIVDARSVSELGNGSSSAGQERLAKLGGKPIKGPGDGVSDSIPATIGGTTPARVARDEVLFDQEAVRRMGGGSVNKGAKKLYAMMNDVHNERKKAKRGQDTKAYKHMPT
jgi:hypothetical protein